MFERLRLGQHKRVAVVRPDAQEPSPRTDFTVPQRRASQALACLLYVFRNIPEGERSPPLCGVGRPFQGRWHTWGAVSILVHGLIWTAIKGPETATGARHRVNKVDQAPPE